MKICMLAYTYYEMDTRVRRYAETLSKRGDNVSAIALRQKGQKFYEEIDGVKIYGPPEGSERTTTVSFTLAGINSNEVSRKLGEKGIFSWDGDFYAVTLVNSVLNLTDQGGLVRLGLAPYNTLDDVKKTLEAIKWISKDSK